MDCHYTGKLLLDYIEDELPNEVSRKIEAHLRKCESCSKEFARIQKIVNLMKTLPSINPTPGIAQKVMAKLEKEERLTRRSFLANFKFLPKRAMIAAATLAVLAFVLYVTMTPFVHYPSFQFQTWAATVQAVPFDLEETGWWARRKKTADERLLPEDKYIGVIFGGILNQPEEINFLVKWIRPDGQPFNETVWKGHISPGLCSFMSDLDISNDKERNVNENVLTASFDGEMIYKKQKGRVHDFPGTWKLEIYINNKLNTTLQIEV
jgi:hypothetical protein